MQREFIWERAELDASLCSLKYVFYSQKFKNANKNSPVNPVVSTVKTVSEEPHHWGGGLSLMI